MTIAENIRQQLEEMTRSERQVAVFVLGRMNQIAFCTLDQLAREADTSTTSVLRFCRKLNYPGYKQFQQAVRVELKYSPSLPDKFQRTTEQPVGDGLLAQTISQGIRCIQQTFQELSYEEITDAVKRISAARRVYTFGMRESQALAMYAYSRLLTVREDVFLYNDGFSGNVESLLSLNEQDVFIVYLFHRYTKRTLQLLEILKNRGVQVILITSPPTDTVNRFATVLLQCQVDASGIKNSSLAPICMADYLCNAVAMLRGEKTLYRMKQSEDLFRCSALLED